MTTADAERLPLVRSLEIMSEYHWMFLRHLHDSVARRLGQPGLEALGRGLWRYGCYRGEFIRDSPAVIAAGRDPGALIRHWDAGELALAAATGDVRVAVADGRATVTLPSAPGAEYFAARAGAGEPSAGEPSAGVSGSADPDGSAVTDSGTEALDLHWRQVLAGMAAGFGQGVSVEVSPAGVSPWTITWRHPSFSQAVGADLDDALASPARYIELGRRTTGLIAALQMFPAMELIDVFDASAEEAVREAAFAFGAERGGALRARHLADGTPVNLQNMSRALAERDPLDALFAVGGELYSSPGVSHFDCTYCPLADIWAGQGSRGLQLGYLFDMELHRGLVETYHPGAIVRWDLLKTRGDAVCRFRFSVPELVTPQEAAMLGPTSRRLDGRQPD